MIGFGAGLVTLLVGRRAMCRRTDRLAGHPTVRNRRSGAPQMIAMVLATVVGSWLVSPYPVVAVGLSGALVGRWRTLRSQRARSGEIRRRFPDCVDMIVLGIRAGLTPAGSVLVFGPMFPSGLREAFDEVTARHRCGERFADALSALHGAHGGLLRPFADALATAERYGEPLAPVLDRLTEEARRDRRRQADTSARQLPVRMCFPLACCTLPAFVILTIVPLLVGTFSSLRGVRP